MTHEYTMNICFQVAKAFSNDFQLNTFSRCIQVITLIVNSFSRKNWSTYYALPTTNGVNSPAFQLNVLWWRGGGEEESACWDGRVLYGGCNGK